MAETFVAVRRGPLGFEQRVCLKRILPGRARDPRFVELFMDEARLLARMRWAGIVQVYDFGESDGTYYMALELVEGVDLDELIRVAHAEGMRLSAEAAMYVAASLLSALAYAHDLTIDGQAQHIIHRDISPSNVLVSTHGEVKLTDFGIAKAHGRSHKTQTGYTKGKPAYMSPEQVRGEALDRRTDLFSTGIVLYQLLTCEHPFEAATDLALFNNIMTGTRRPLSEVDPGLPSELVLLVDALLEVDPARRPQTASDALAYISGSVKFIEGQRALAQRVNHCVGRKTSSRAPTLVAGFAPSSAPTEARDGSTKLLLPPSEVSTEVRPQGPKNTSARPLPATSEARRRRGIAFALGALLGAIVLGFLIRGELGARVVPRAHPSEPTALGAARPTQATNELSHAGGLQGEVAVPVSDGGALSLPVQRPAARTAGTEAAIDAPPRGETERDAGARKVSGSAKPRSARHGARAVSDAGAHEKPWIEVTRDEF